jgi:membrane protein
MEYCVLAQPLLHYARRANDRIQATILAFRSDKANIYAAGLAYYGAISIVPLLVMLIAVPGLVLRFSDTPQAVAADILGAAEITFGPSFRAFLEQALNDLQRESLAATLIAVGGLLFSSSLVFRYISRCFRFIWNPSAADAENMSEAMRKTMVAKVLDRLIGVVMALVLSAALVVSVVLGTLASVIQRLLDVFPLLAEFTSWAIGPATTIALSTFVFLLLFKFVPPVPMHWRDVWPSALICALGWEIGKQALLFYIISVGSRSSYAAITVILAVLFWLNANGLVLFFCAELCKVTARERGR